MFSRGTEDLYFRDSEGPDTQGRGWSRAKVVYSWHLQRTCQVGCLFVTRSSSGKCLVTKNQRI